MLRAAVNLTLSMDPDLVFKRNLFKLNGQRNCTMPIQLLPWKCEKKILLQIERHTIGTKAVRSYAHKSGSSIHIYH